MGIEEVLTAPQSPRQNAFCKTVIGSIRRDCPDHAIVLNERHLKRVLTSYINYYHRWRTHLSLEMDSPESRLVQPPALGKFVEFPEVVGLDHHYERLVAQRKCDTSFREAQLNLFSRYSRYRMLHNTT